MRALPRLSLLVSRHDLVTKAQEADFEGERSARMRSTAGTRGANIRWREVKAISPEERGLDVDRFQFDRLAARRAYGRAGRSVGRTSIPYDLSGLDHRRVARRQLRG